MSDNNTERGDGDLDRMTQVPSKQGLELENNANKRPGTVAHRAHNVEIEFETDKMATAVPSNDGRLNRSVVSPTLDGTSTFAPDESNTRGHQSFEPSNSNMTTKEGITTDMRTEQPPLQKSTSPIQLRVQFEDFAAQLRLHRHHEHKKRMLQHRRQNLQTALALCARLHRVGSWIHDGLVEISRYNDAVGFTRVQQHMQDLADLCFSHWDHQIQALDVVNVAGNQKTNQPGNQSFFGKLSDVAQSDFLELIRTLRNNPRFLVERLKSMSASQVAALSTSPKYQKLSDSVLRSLPENRGRASQRRRIETFSKGLEEYASSFERSNSLSFLLHHVYGAHHGGTRAESQLRLSTWSTICADLFHDAEPTFAALINQVLSSFATFSEWRVKDRIELYLMDVLQRGAFLLDSVDSDTPGLPFQPFASDPLNTEGAHEFFDQAVAQLFAILAHHDGGLPTAAHELGRATLGKISDVDHQSAFRGYFMQWFLSEFLRIVITYPENEKMLLQYHISENARSNILQELWRRVSAQANDSLCNPPITDHERDLHFCVSALVAQLSPIEPRVNPYSIPEKTTDERDEKQEAVGQASFISICSADIVHVLEALRPQYIHGSGHWGLLLSSSQSTFNSQYSRASNKFDRLRNEILLNTEPGSSTKNLHPCQEQWLTLALDVHGYPVSSLATDLSQPSLQQTLISELGNLDPAQDAAVRLFLDDSNDLQLLLSNHDKNALSDLFSARARLAQGKMDSVDALYWHSADAFLHQKYKVAVLAQNYTRVFLPSMEKSSSARDKSLQLCNHLEEHINILEDAYTNGREMMSLSRLRLDKLRIKMWYAVDVTSSQAYDEAKNVSIALTHMALKTPVAFGPNSRTSTDRDRPGTRSSASSMFDQPRVDTLGILKASTEHGGSRKLADGQIEMTKKWLKRNNVDNFCKGEERIHRFCMEIKMVTKRLIGDTLAESPVLWSSGLFAREKYLFDSGGLTTFSIQGSTRAPSVMSETLSSGYHSMRPSLRNVEIGSRSLGSEIQDLPARKTSFHSSGSSSRISRDFLGSDIASSIGSPGRATTATTPETASSIWSPHQSYSRSATSASMYSRPSSIFNDIAIFRTSDTGRERTKFLENLQEHLTCLLLSDLGCPLWSYGSETDSWMKNVRQTSSINRRLQERQLVANLVSEKAGPESHDSNDQGGHLRERRQSNPFPMPNLWIGDDAAVQGSGPFDGSIFDVLLEQSTRLEYPHDRAFGDVLDRISQHVDPVLKLQAVHDFKLLSMSILKFRKSCVESKAISKKSSQPELLVAGRRKSLDSEIAFTLGSRSNNSFKAMATDQLDGEPSEIEIVKCLKELLLGLKPKTLFRDLQYIATFVPLDTLNKTESGKAFLQVGLAALASKDEVCRSMVDVADRLVARDLIKRKAVFPVEAEPQIIKAADYWMFAAREGNPIAQRELASLYLTHPEVLPIVSLPLSLSTETFKSEMMWEEQETPKGKSQALCLALHWMQQAAKNGDDVAQQKLQERKETYSIR